LIPNQEIIILVILKTAKRMEEESSMTNKEMKYMKENSKTTKNREKVLHTKEMDKSLNASTETTSWKALLLSLE